MTGRELELDQLINLFIHAKDRVSLYRGFYITLLTTIAGWLTTGGSSNQNLEVWLKLEFRLTPPNHTVQSSTYRRTMGGRRKSRDNEVKLVNNQKH